jgi:hypothetical protein
LRHRILSGASYTRLATAAVQPHRFLLCGDQLSVPPRGQLPECPADNATNATKTTYFSASMTVLGKRARVIDWVAVIALNPTTQTGWTLLCKM